MSLSYTYTPQIWPQAVKALMLIALAVYSGRRRSLPGELSFTFALLFGALWMVGVSLEVVCIDPRSPTAWQSINEVNPTVLTSDLSDPSTSVDLTLLREKPGVLLIGVDPESDEILVLSGRLKQALSVPDLV